MILKCLDRDPGTLFHNRFYCHNALEGPKIAMVTNLKKNCFISKKIILILILMLFRYDLRGATDLNSLSKGDQKKIWSPKLAFTNAKVIGGTKDSDK